MSLKKCQYVEASSPQPGLKRLFRLKLNSTGCTGTPGAKAPTENLHTQQSIGT